MYLSQKLKHYYPAAAWNWPHEGDFETLDWFGPGDKPTLTELDALDDPPPPVPETVSRFQARAALHQAGLLNQIEALMADPQTDPIAVIAWEDAAEFRRSSPTIAILAGALGLTDQQLDDLFRAAAQIEA